MNETTAKLLSLPFESGDLPLPSGEQKLLCLNAASFPTTDFDWRGILSCVQPERSGFSQLSRAGFTVEPELSPDYQITGALIIASKHKRLNEIHFSTAWNLLQPGQLIVVGGMKNEGISSFRKFAASHSSIEGAVNKYHGQVFWLRRGSDDVIVPANSVATLDGYITAPGMFSADKVDAGSKLLAEYFDKRISGNVADFGCGWGYLAGELLDRSDKIRQLDLYESYYPALAAAKNNLIAGMGSVRCDPFWKDVTSEPVTRKYDWIVMNPPFHASRKGEPGIGQKFIEVAARSLRQSGRLLMVANTHLPYERSLEKPFRSYEKLAQRDGFKVIEARK